MYFLQRILVRRSWYTLDKYLSNGSIRAAGGIIKEK